MALCGFESRLPHSSAEPLTAGGRTRVGAEQAIRTATMPFIYPHLALMPDAHQVGIWTGCKG